MFGIGFFELVLLLIVASGVGAVAMTSVLPRVRARGIFREWTRSDDQQIIGSRLRLRARPEVEAYVGKHARAGEGWIGRAPGVSISGATTLWIERRKSEIGGAPKGFVSGDAGFDAAFFMAGDGGTLLDQIVRQPSFQLAIRTIFARVDPRAIELDVDGTLFVHLGRGLRDVPSARELIDATTTLADGLAAVATDVKAQRALAPTGGTAGSVGSESGAPVPIPARRT